VPRLLIIAAHGRIVVRGPGRVDPFTPGFSAAC
jgi:hypothetical protein